MFEDDMDTFFDMPGGDDFEDVTDIFDSAASGIASDEVAFTEGFTLLDSMSAFEIGEPRMDSGMILEEDRKPPFDPLTPLLPQEVCWILDRSFACEMEWHAGNTLSQTVYTLLYIHHLPQIDPDLLRHPRNGQAPRAQEGLVTTPLRSAVVGLMKCCDLTWRELSKGNVHDTEDWQGEKCDISLLEGTPVEYAVRILDDACLWLQNSSLSREDKTSLADRLLLRKSLLELMRLRLPVDLHKLRPLIITARNILRRIRDSPKTHSPETISSAHSAFDSHVTRRLHNFIPIRIVELPSQSKTWDAIESLLRGWDNVDHLLSCHSLFAWDISGTIQATFRDPYPPYIRSLIQSAFQDRNTVFGVYPTVWLVEHYFSESLGVPYEAIAHTMRVHWRGMGAFSTRDLERQLITGIVNHYRTYWLNPPRRRRYLMKSVLDWKLIHDGLRSLTSQLIVEDADTQILIDAVTVTPLLWQISVAREIILSGFQQELYTADERPVAYWYAAQVIKIHLSFFNTLSGTVTKDTHAGAELLFQTDYLTGLQAMCLASCVISYKPAGRSAERMSINFRRRYKWLFTQVFPGNQEELLIPVPTFQHFLSSVTALLPYSVKEAFQSAKANLCKAADMDLNTFVAPGPAKERLQYVQQLIIICDQLAGFTDENMRWDPSLHPWFPSLEFRAA